jgi:hypothetical protein
MTHVFADVTLYYHLNFRLQLLMFRLQGPNALSDVHLGRLLMLEFQQTSYLASIRYEINVFLGSNTYLDKFHVTLVRMM